MFASPTAMWLDSAFAGFDHFFLSIQHFFGEHLGFVLTPLMRLITFLGEKGILFFLLALVLMLMADKRDLGVCIFGAVCCGALITNIILKDSVGRVRPFEASGEFNAWWQAIGGPSEDGFSFPSGHVTACAAGMTAITCMRGKKWLVPTVVVVAVMAISRTYLMAHYPSDVLFAAIIGAFSGIVAWFITQLIFRFLRRKRNAIPVCGLILDFDIRDVLPFQLPALPSGKARGRTDGRRAAPRPEPEAANPDEDVKTYAGSGRHSVQPAPAETRAAAPARSGGRHAKPEAEAPARAAKKSGRFSVPGGYQGKH